MAEGNGEIIEEMATTQKTDGTGEPERTADYPKLVEYGLDKRVNFRPIKLYLLEPPNRRRSQNNRTHDRTEWYFLSLMIRLIFRWQPN